MVIIYHSLRIRTTPWNTLWNTSHIETLNQLSELVWILLNKFFSFRFVCFIFCVEYVMLAVHFNTTTTQGPLIKTNVVQYRMNVSMHYNGDSLIDLPSKRVFQMEKVLIISVL